MTSAQYQYKIGIIILVANLSILPLIVILDISRAIYPEDTIELLKFFIPVKSVYLTALVKYIIVNKRNITTEDERELPLSKLYIRTTMLIICSHILFIISLVMLYALGKIISFASLKNFLVITETFFGAYIGIIISDMFKVDGTNMHT